jgi:capsular polysaccharide biosynthesis protein
MQEKDSKDKSVYFKAWKEIAICAFIFSMIFFSVSAFIPPKYIAEGSVLVSKNNAFDLDAYKEAKSAEFTGRIVREIILSNSFMRNVLESNTELNSYFISISKNEQEKLENWRKLVSVSQVPNTGILNISSKTPSKSQSKELLNSIVLVINNNVSALTGDELVGVKVVDDPFYLEDPTPNIWLNAIAGGVFGTILAVILITVYGAEAMFIKKRKTINLREKIPSLEQKFVLQRK